MSAVPPQIITAAREAVAAEITYRLDEVPGREIVRIALEAAAPLLEAAERERCAQICEREADDNYYLETTAPRALQELAALLREQP